MQPRRALLKKEQWGHHTVPGQPAFPTQLPAHQRIPGVTGMAHPGVPETPPLCIVNALSEDGK